MTATRSASAATMKPRALKTTCQSSCLWNEETASCCTSIPPKTAMRGKQIQTEITESLWEIGLTQPIFDCTKSGCGRISTLSASQCPNLSQVALLEQTGR